MEFYFKARKVFDDYWFWVSKEHFITQTWPPTKTKYKYTGNKKFTILGTLILF